MQEYIEFRNTILNEIYNLSHKDKMWNYNRHQTNVSKEEFFRQLDKSLRGKFFVDSFLEVSKVFMVDDDVSQLLYMTKNKVYERKTPFDNFFINTSFTLKDGTLLKGILVFKHKILGEYKFTAAPLLIRKNGDFAFNSDFAFMFFGLFSSKIKRSITQDNVFESDDINAFKLLKGGEIQNFVCNFLDFLNNPEVEIVEVERDEEQNKKRIARDKIPLPPSFLVQVTGTIKKYIGGLRSSGHFSFSHRFWVRGHFRTLRAERYGDNIGMKRWIFPYIKGEGILIKKAYNVKK